jgi:hypothetical protein
MEAGNDEEIFNLDNGCVFIFYNRISIVYGRGAIIRRRGSQRLAIHACRYA